MKEDVGKKTILHPFHILWTIPFSNIFLVFLWQCAAQCVHYQVWCTHWALHALLLGIIHCGAAWPLVSLLLQAAGTPGTRTNETKLICIGTIYQWAFKSASSSSPASVERINQRNFGQICLISSFGPSEENSIQLEGKDICNGWLSRSGTYSNICNIPINCQ